MKRTDTPVVRKIVNNVIISPKETVAQSWGRDLGSFVMFFGLIGFGVFLDSAPMQWAGLLTGFLFLFSRAITGSSTYKVDTETYRTIINIAKEGAKK